MPDMTVSEIAIQAGVPAHRVRYVVRSLRMTPLRRISGTHLFSDQQATAISAALLGAGTRNSDADAATPEQRANGYKP